MYGACLVCTTTRSLTGALVATTMLPARDGAALGRHRRRPCRLRSAWRACRRRCGRRRARSLRRGRRDTSADGTAPGSESAGTDRYRTPAARGRSWRRCAGRRDGSPPARDRETPRRARARRTGSRRGASKSHAMRSRATMLSMRSIAAVWLSAASRDAALAVEPLELEEAIVERIDEVGGRRAGHAAADARRRRAPPPTSQPG